MKGNSDMKDKNRLTIGLMVHHLDNDYSKLLLKGAVKAACELDINLVILPGRSLNCQMNDKKFAAYEYQYNTIYSYASSCNLDALIVSAGTVGQFVTKEEFKKFLDGFDGLPIVTTENDIVGYPCIRLSGSGIKNIVNHLINEHGKKKIAFVSGPEGNSDADERLSYYREALIENGIEYDPQLVAYGRFSEYCVDLVGELLDKNKDIDAICFANDMMCKGGYKAIEQRGLVVGKDIAVTGYDDSEIASTLNPMLTTLRADAAKLGSCAVKEAVKLAQGKEIEKLTSLGSSLVIRQSCGCSTLWNESSETHKVLIKSATPEQLAEKLVLEYFDENSEEHSFQSHRLNSFICDLLRFSQSDKNVTAENVCDEFNQLMSKGFAGIIQPDTIVDILKAVRYTAIIIADGDKEKIIEIHNIVEYCFETISDTMLITNREVVDDLTFTHFLINNIAKDMTIQDSDEEKSYFSIVNNLYRTHMNSSYIYSYADPVINTQSMEWKRPQYLYLKSFHDGDNLASVKKDEQEIDSLSCISNKFTPDRRRTVILFPLFLNEEHYGIIVSEIEYEFFGYIYSVAPQICTAIKLTRLVNQLECSLNDTIFQNSQLNRISMYDELTGVYNRRGFFEFANRILTSPDNEGKSAVIIFGDLDNLKKINDTFGHDDGDYSIICAADFIKSGLRNTDIVGRIGGDEFAAFALCADKKIISSIPSRIKQIAEKFNEKSDKQFNVTMSVGTYEVICSPDSNIQSFMKYADTALYEDKKNKNSDIMKH